MSFVRPSFPSLYSTQTGGHRVRGLLYLSRYETSSPRHLSTVPPVIPAIPAMTGGSKAVPRPLPTPGKPRDGGAIRS
jgi:hypothetical protein